jgi:hypothetical protein
MKAAQIKRRIIRDEGPDSHRRIRGAALGSLVPGGGFYCISLDGGPVLKGEASLRPRSCSRKFSTPWSALGVQCSLADQCSRAALWLRAP